MSCFDLQYNNIIKEIMKNGEWDKNSSVRTKWEDDSPAYTKSIISQKMRFDNSELPILTAKKVGWKTAIKEMLWIWQMKSNKVQDLRDMGVNIWNEWELEDGTIGKSYGYQLAKKNREVGTITTTLRGGNDEVVLSCQEAEYVDQVDYLLDQLASNPTSRRHMTNLWNPDELDEMSLTPCVYETQWYVRGNKLDLEVRARSNDMALGNPFNVFQYNVLQRMIAQIIGYELGEYVYNIGDCHFYEKHIDGLTEQINRETFKAPKLWINPDVKSFYDFTIDDFKLIDYQHGDKIDFEVAI
ncbi:thymidylate synthase [Virgibacillus halotolerans]|uniref:thymidylate synthase n=1 Tax=Virgibacillus halotolerans TaxID=1071053 RepID=UPI001961F302|nr:thymidylate synthase [Virgibacillus halotolerans]MBM7598294.1 thymidylate synthase [Virgibacillus halotolerans]